MVSYIFNTNNNNNNNNNNNIDYNNSNNNSSITSEQSVGQVNKTTAIIMVQFQIFFLILRTTTITPTMMAKIIIKTIIKITHNFMDFHIIFLRSLVVVR